MSNNYFYCNIKYILSQYLFAVVKSRSLRLRAPFILIANKKQHPSDDKCYFLFTTEKGHIRFASYSLDHPSLRLRYRSSPFLLKTIINCFLNAKTPTGFEPPRFYCKQKIHLPDGKCIFYLRPRRGSNPRPPA